MKAFFTLLLSAALFVQANAQCSATINYQQNPNAFFDNFWADNFTGDSTSAVFLWQFCDGSTATGQYVQHSLSPGGQPLTNCLVCLTISDSTTGCTFTTCDTFNATTVTPTGCTAYATYTEQNGTYSFFASSLSAQPILYEWTVNGQLYDTNATTSLYYDSTAYPNGANVCVTVTDVTGCAAFDCISLGGSNTFPGGGGAVPCQAYFVIYPDTGANTGGQPGVYYGFNFSAGNYDYVIWDFGDGTTSTDPYPVHTYNTPGNYILCLTVGSADSSCYDTYCDSSFYAFKTEQNPMGQLTILAPTGIRENEKETVVSLFPNPVSSELSLSVTAESLKVRNLLGREVLSFNTAVNRVDVSRLQQGMYVVEGITNGRKFRSTFVKGL